MLTKKKKNASNQLTPDKEKGEWMSSFLEVASCGICCPPETPKGTCGKIRQQSEATSTSNTVYIYAYMPDMSVDVESASQDQGSDFQGKNNSLNGGYKVTNTPTINITALTKKGTV